MKILYVGEDIGQINTAMFIHVTNVAKLLISKGHEVEFLSLADDKNFNDKNIEGFNWHYASYYRNSIIRKIIDFTNLFFGYQIISNAIRLKKHFPYNMIIYYGYTAEERLISFCKKNNVLFVIERVDWFEKSDRKSWGAKYIYQSIVNKCYKDIDFKADAIIVISDYLKKHFSHHNIPILQLPPIFPLVEFAGDKEKNKLFDIDCSKPIRLVYCGSLGGGKDTIEPIIGALKKINDNHIYYTLDVVGINQYDYERIMGAELNSLEIKFHGKLSHKMAIEVLKKSDISILLRQNKKYAKAGFSTKFAESMLCGVPVFCTIVGGADTCIKDMENGFLVQSNSVNVVENKLRHIMSLRVLDIKKIKKRAFEYAKNNFTIESKRDDIDEFFDKIIKR